MTDNEYMIWLGFNQSEINTAYNIVRQNGGRSVNTDSIMKYFGADYITANRIRYIVNIIIGKKNINTKNVREFTDLKGMSQHFRYMNGDKEPQVSINRLIPSRIGDIPKVAVIRGIEDDTYGIFNSNSPEDISSYYIVDKVTQNEITVRSKKSVVLKYNKSGKYGLDGVINVIGKDLKGNTIIAVNREYCRLCNRYVVVASLRMPSNHVGAYAMISRGGDIIYVYAKVIDGNRSVGKTASERVYGWGVLKGNIKKQITAVAVETYNELGCIYSKYFEPEIDFRLSPKRVVEEDIVQA